MNILSLVLDCSILTGIFFDSEISSIFFCNSSVLIAKLESILIQSLGENIFIAVISNSLVLTFPEKDSCNGYRSHEVSLTLSEYSVAHSQ
jgi:hypothetical protein